MVPNDLAHVLVAKDLIAHGFIIEPGDRVE